MWDANSDLIWINRSRAAYELRNGGIVRLNESVLINKRTGQPFLDPFNPPTGIEEINLFDPPKQKDENGNE
jgi:hypothetical protein